MSSLEKHMDDALLMLFISGEANAEQINEVMDWMALSKDNQDYLDQLQEIWLKSGELDISPLEVDTNAAWEKVHSKIIPKQTSAKKITFRPQSLLQYAAVFIALVAGVWLVQKFWNERPPEKIQSGELVFKDTLVDGSLIALNSNSEISYTNSFNKKKREVRLKGEAFFQVTKNPEKEFVVYADETFVTVIGTSFNIKAMEQDSIVELSVVEGVVRFSNISEIGDTVSIVLEASEKAIFSKRTKGFEKIVEPADIYWLDQTLIFDKTTLSKVFSSLEQIFNTKIQVKEEKINGLLLSATFKDNSIEEILLVITATFNLDYKLEDGEYIISQIKSNE